MTSSVSPEALLCPGRLDVPCRHHLWGAPALQPPRAQRRCGALARRNATTRCVPLSNVLCSDRHVCRSATLGSSAWTPWHRYIGCTTRSDGDARRGAAAPRWKAVGTPLDTALARGAAARRLHVGPVAAVLQSPDPQAPALLSAGSDGVVCLAGGGAQRGGEALQLVPFDAGVASAAWCSRNASVFAVRLMHAWPHEFHPAGNCSVFRCAARVGVLCFVMWATLPVSVC